MHKLILEMLLFCPYFWREMHVWIVSPTLVFAPIFIFYLETKKGAQKQVETTILIICNEFFIELSNLILVHYMIKMTEIIIGI